MKKIQEYKRDLNVVNKEITLIKDNIVLIKAMIVDYEGNETYKMCMKHLGELIFIKSWLENKLQLNLVD